MTSLPSSKPRTEGLGAPAAVDGGALRAMLADVVDYAGLFPPAGLDMSSAVRVFDAYRAAERSWMLGAFVVPTARLGELAAAVERVGASSPWPISVLAPSPQLDDVARIRVPDALHVRAIEIAPLEPEKIHAENGGVQHFHEVPLDERMDARLDAILRAGAAAKVRTGGVESRAFPPAERLARFIDGCAERRLPFKATAGLHHPVRGQYALTYEPDSPRWEMFGFLEVALASVLSWHRRIDAREAAALLGGPPAAVEPSSDSLAWAGHRVDTDEIAAARRSFFRSFGSCSFEEPVADLTRLGLL